jgi:MFS family permease
VPVPVGIVPLRPLGVGEILDGAFQAVRSNPRSMIGVSAAVVAAVTLLSLVPQAFVLHGLGSAALGAGDGLSTREQLDALSGALEAQLFPAALTFFAVTVLNALLIVPVSAAVLGRRTPPGEMWQRAKGRLLPAIGLALLTGLALGAVVVGLLVPGIVLLAAGPPALGALLLFAGVVAAVVLGVLLAVRWALAAPALVLERASVTTAMRRSWRLTQGSFWRVLGILLLTGIIVSIGQAAISFPLSALSSLPAAGQSDPYENLGTVFAQLLISGVGSIVAGAVFYTFNAASSALLYIDLRMRREGLDVRLAQAAAQGGPMP